VSLITTPLGTYFFFFFLAAVFFFFAAGFFFLVAMTVKGKKLEVDICIVRRTITRESD
jgi:hypothetical protein